MVRVPEARRTIIFLSNMRTMTRRLDDFAVAIGRILDAQSYSMPKRSVAEAVAAAVKGISSTNVARSFERMRADTAQYAVSESEINRLGYFHLARGDTALGVTNYRKSLDLDPKNTNAAAVLKPIAP